MPLQELWIGHIFLRHFYFYIFKWQKVLAKIILIALFFQYIG